MEKSKYATIERLLTGDNPKRLIYDISEDLLQCFSNLSLIDKYDIYQHLLTYWTETMQDDLYALSEEGWESGRQIEKLDKKKEWEGRLVPRALIISRYFSTEQKAIEKMEAERDDVARQMEEMEEEHGGEEGLISEARNEKDKINKASVEKRLKEIQKDEDAADEREVLQNYLKLAEQKADGDKKIKEAQVALDKMILEKYKSLTIEEIKILIVEDKWLARMENDVITEMQRISQRLAQRIKELAERYENTLSFLDQEVEELEEKVNRHLVKMGFV